MQKGGSRALIVHDDLPYHHVTSLTVDDLLLSKSAPLSAVICDHTCARDFPITESSGQTSESVQHKSTLQSVMVVKIRLARFGKRHAPFYNIVVAHAR